MNGAQNTNHEKTRKAFSRLFVSFVANAFRTEIPASFMGQLDVAIKVLHEEFAKDTDRVARFQREAKLLASPITPISPPSNWKNPAAQTSLFWS